MKSDPTSDLKVMAQEALDSLLSMIEQVDVEGRIECDVGDGMIEATCNGLVYLISWHQPSSQIWVASPISGSVRFSYNAGDALWYDTQSARGLLSFVERDICAAFSLREQ
ncbi:MAG: frataxin domain-containing protein [Anaplasma ovis]|uniref:CyaY protein n=1 Tax=Anaplasma ovis str. Haibei TaxID=1248439 RepID=A0A2Z2LB50_9RICK|nr:frataxin domain-containing protein [Anaplasma ovis]ASI47428.1 CyaY protein [Anaplasma ovis str. Haibei]